MTYKLISFFFFLVMMNALQGMEEDADAPISVLVGGSSGRNISNEAMHQKQLQGKINEEHSIAIRNKKRLEFKKYADFYKENRNTMLLWGSGTGSITAACSYALRDIFGKSLAFLTAEHPETVPSIMLEPKEQLACLCCLFCGIATGSFCFFAYEECQNYCQHEIKYHEH